MSSSPQDIEYIDMVRKATQMKPYDMKQEMSEKRNFSTPPGLTRNELVKTYISVMNPKSPNTETHAILPTTFEHFDDILTMNTIIHTLSKAREDDLCHGIGTEQYWLNLRQYPVSFIVCAKHGKQIVGVMLVRQNYELIPAKPLKDSFYIELVCGKNGSGGALINYLKTKALELKMTMMYLSSLPTKVSYYSKKHQFHLATGAGPEKQIQNDLWNNQIQKLYEIDLEIMFNQDKIKVLQANIESTQKKIRTTRSAIKNDDNQVKNHQIKQNILRQNRLQTLRFFKETSTFYISQGSAVHRTQETEQLDYHIEDTGLFMSCKLRTN